MTQNKTRIIGLTGGIGTGKSTVSNIIRDKGYIVLDADKIAREVVAKGTEGYKKIVEEFGQDILLEDGELNRKVVANIVFKDEIERKKLNRITHPLIFNNIKILKEELSKKNEVLFLDIPLLYEEYDLLKEHGIILDEIWVVYVDLETQINRIMIRDNISRENSINRINSQLPVEEKMSRASKILDNSKEIRDLERQIDELLIIA